METGETLRYGSCMYILGGFDGTRRNDMYKIAVPEQLPRDEKRRPYHLETSHTCT